MDISRIPIAEYVYLSSNPNSTMKSGWGAKSRRHYEIADFDYGLLRFSLAGNFPIPARQRQAARIVSGTRAPIALSDRSWGHVAALAVFTGRQRIDWELGGLVTYAETVTWSLPRDQWIPGRHIFDHPNYPSRGRFVRLRRNGERLNVSEMDVVRDLLHDGYLKWWDMVSAETKARAIPLGRRGRKKLPHHPRLYVVS